MLHHDARRQGLVLALMLLVCPMLAARAELPPLIPREVLFGNPQRAEPRLSPDGTRLAWLSPDEHGVMQLWVKPLTAAEPRCLTSDRKRFIRWYFWSWDSTMLLYVQDSEGDERFHLFGVELASGNVRDYTPFEGVTANVLADSPLRPTQLLLQMNLRDRSRFDVYRLDLRTGALSLDVENPGGVGSWFADTQLVVRAARVIRPDGGTRLLVRSGAGAPFRNWLEAGPSEALTVLGFTHGGRAALLLSSLGADTARVVERELATGRERVLAAHARVDVREQDVLLDPAHGTLQAAAFDTGRKRWTVVDPALRRDLEALAGLAPGDFTVVSRDAADARWLVSYVQDRAPERFFLYERKSRTGELLFSTRPQLEGVALAETRTLSLRARDGLELPSYLTLPPGVPARALPMVVLVHGGPWWRDVWGFDPQVQLLANRGYAVLQVNFRGSLGFGKAHLRAGARQWGRRMQDDLVDGVRWAIAEGVADPARVAIQGRSYGGYAALAGATFTPDIFRCAVSLSGISNLETLVRSFPATTQMRGVWNERVGNVDDPADTELLSAASPAHHAERIRIPLLIGHGANDPRVTRAEAEQIVAAVERNGKEAVYVLYPDEGHGLGRQENRLDFSARAEAFLAQHLGGRAEPLSAERLPGASAVVRYIGP